jgi:type III secretory pathway lipoprotein EscJ
MPVSVAVVASRTEAELIVGMLRSHGVHAQLSADDAGGVDLALQAQGVRVLVPTDDARRARDLLGEAEAGPTHLNALQRLVIRVLGGARKS